MVRKVVEGAGSSAAMGLQLSTPDKQNSNSSSLGLRSTMSCLLRKKRRSLSWMGLVSRHYGGWDQAALAVSAPV